MRLPLGSLPLKNFSMKVRGLTPSFFDKNCLRQVQKTCMRVGIVPSALLNINGLRIPVLLFLTVCPLREGAWRYGCLRTK